MTAFPLLLLASLTGATGSGTAATRAAARSYVATYSVTYLARAHARIPAWARKYNMNCSGCHYPAPPRLNATGMRFKWAGYRMPEDFTDQVSVEKVQNYVSALGEADYTYEKTSGSPTTTNAFSLPAVTLFYAGPFGKHFSAFFELEHGSDGEIERIAQLGGVWGTDKAYWGVRGGQFHNLVEWGVAGFDRLPGVAMPIALDGPITATVPFSLAGPRLGAEAFLVRGNNRLSAEVLNGMLADGTLDAGEGDLQKDVLVTDQLLIDNAGSGVQAVAYYGSIIGLDTAVAPTLKTHFWRLGASANKIVNDFEVLGGIVYARDLDLPGGAPATTGIAYWVSGQYVLPHSSSLSLYGRYEHLDPDRNTSGDAINRIVTGAVLPVMVPEYLRCALEYHLDAPQGGAPKTSNLTAAFTLAF